MSRITQELQLKQKTMLRSLYRFKVINIFYIIMFLNITTCKKIRNGTLEELNLPSQIKLYLYEESKKDIGLKDIWIAGYTDVFLMCGSFITEYIIDTPVFTNIQWVLTTTDYPDGELATLFYLGTLRSEKKTIKLYGDYKNQSIDITELVKKEVYNDMCIRYNSSNKLYNMNDSVSSAAINVVGAMMKAAK